MFTGDELREMLHTRPFVPFRLVQSDGAAIEVRSPEAVVVGKRWAVIGLLDPKGTDTLFDRYAVVYFLHVARTEQLGLGPPPFSSSGPPQSPTPA